MTARIDRSYYDESEYFDGATTPLHDYGSRFQRYRIRKVLGLHTPGSGDRVLDMGSGWGTMTFALAPFAREVVGLDFSHRAVDLCNARLANSGLGNARFVKGDARASGFDDASFDAVYAADLFEHLYLDDARRVAAEAFRVLRPGGTVVVWMPCRSHFLEVLRNRNIILKRDISHVGYRSKPRMEALLRDAGFTIAQSRFAESHLPGLDVLERMGQRWVPLLRRRIALVAEKP